MERILCAFLYASLAVVCWGAAATAQSRDDMRIRAAVLEQNKSNPARMLTDYRNRLEALNRPVDPTGTRGPMLRSAATSIELDPRTQQNFGAEFMSDTRIWMGVPTGSQFPESVAILTTNNQLCSGTLINEDTVLTAAHCFCNRTPTEVIVGSTVGATFAPRYAVDMTRSKKLMDCGRHAQGDVGYLRLKGKPGVAPAKLGRSDVISAAKSARIVGFGRTEKGGIGKKYMVDVPITSVICEGTSPKGADSKVYGCHPGLEIVASSPLTSQDSCSGDSGGSVFVQAAGGSWVLAAVVSRGIEGPNTRPCGDGSINPRVDGRAGAWLSENGVGFVLAP